ncbi:hypothetical protein F444_08178 [Phytophthora nicotianae P1976]|uniref:Uncharacterized protein n=1 Tax=Phytophthora nicotianae P1976 TaxID=1317066 RepID=A0A081AC14_PHYNI|nr:hypothetical protein F444_08178 [Phytophthora nicotianae P1976]
MDAQASPASSIETRWKFVPPGGNPFGIEGKDYFLGEDRVLAHYAAVQSTRAQSSAISAKVSVCSGDGAGLATTVDENEPPNVDPSPLASTSATMSNSTTPSPLTNREVTMHVMSPKRMSTSWYHDTSGRFS